MNGVTFFLDNWYMMIAAVAVAVVIGAAIGRFFDLPSAEQRRKVKEWLLLAVTEAETQLGSGTGQLKLRYVYDLFVQRFPMIAKKISFDTFSYWVDEALIQMREMLKENKQVRQIVGGEANGKNQN